MYRPYLPSRRLWVALVRCAAILLILLPVLAVRTREQTPVVLAHNLDQRMNWIQYDDATRAVLAARSQANDLPLMRVNDELGMIIKVTPFEGTDTGAGGYITFYIPNGAQVLDAAYLVPDGAGNLVPAAMKGAAIEPLGDGPISAKITTALIGLTLGPNVVGQTSTAVSSSGLHRGTLAGVYADTGIFYSTDPTTAWRSWVNSNPPLGTSITNNRGEVMVPNNKWDAMQMYAWGIKSPTAPIIDPDGRGNSPWGMANGVAGPESGYAWSFDKDFWDANPGLPINQRMQGAIEVGPWNRIQYPGSQISKDTPGNLNDTLGFVGVLGSNVGYALSPGNPLPATVSQTDTSSPKAIRWSVGGIILNRPEYAWVKVKLLDAAPFDNCVTIFDTDVVGGDAGGLDNAKDHLWRYYQPTSAKINTCIAQTKRASRPVVGKDEVFQYDLEVVNTSTSITLNNVQIADTLPSGITYLSAVPAPNSGPNPLVWTIPSLPPGGRFAATVTVKASSTGLKINGLCTSASNFSQTCINEDITVGSIPLLVQSKSASTATIEPGDSVQYTLTVNNLGTGSTGSPFKVTDYLPAGFTYASLNSVTLNGANALGLTSVDSSDPTQPVFTINGSLNAAQSLVLVFTANASPTLLPGVYCNTYVSVYGNSTITSGIEACVTVGGAVIGDTLFRDWNGNGVQDTQDGGLPGATVNLYAGACPPSGGPIRTATTDVDGKYQFNGLSAGTYCVDAPAPGAGGVPSGYSLTTGADPLQVTVASNQVFLTADFGYDPGGVGQIGDLVFEDQGLDGTYNPGLGDVGIPGVTVNLYEDSNGDGEVDPILDALVTTTTTNGSGAYLFTGLAEDISYVVEVPPAGLTAYFGNPAWAASTADPAPVPNLSGSYLDADLGYGRVVPGSIGDLVFRDLNNNGVFDGTDSGIVGVPVRLYQDTNANGALDPGEPLLQTTTTDGAGLYTFNNVPAGNYIVDVDETSPNVPAGFAPARDLIPASLTVGQNRTDIDFPFVRVLSKSVDKTFAQPGEILTYTLIPSYTGGQLLNNLIITDRIPAGTTFVDAGQGGTLGSGYVSAPGTPGFRPASTGGGGVTLSPTQDSWINENGSDKTKNYGASTTLTVEGEIGKRRHALLQFDLSSIPSDATITSATLTLTKVGGDSKTSVVEVTALTQNWSEGNKNGNTCNLMGEVNWNTTDCFTPWTTPGGTTNGTSYATATVPATKVPVTWDVATLVQAWVNGSVTNHGLMLRQLPELSGGQPTQNFASSEASNVAQRPSLSITYTAVTGPASGTTLSVSPTSVSSGGGVVVSMVLTSTGTINNAFPGPLNVSGTNGAGASCVGPAPGSPQTVSPGPGVTFTWNCTTAAPSGTGILTFSGGATGAGGYTFATATSNTAQVFVGAGNVVSWDLGSSCPAVQGVTAPPGTALCPTTVTLPSVADTYVKLKDPNDNYGDESTMVTRPANIDYITHSLVRFDTSAIPAGAVIQSAKLNLYVDSYRSSNHIDEVHQATTAWTEGDGSTGSGATWNTTDGATSWASGGFSSADYDSQVLGTIIPNSKGTRSVDVSIAVDNWVNGGQPNEGFVLLSTGSDTGDAKYVTRDGSNTARRPSLTVIYLLPTVGGCSGTTTLTPFADTFVNQYEETKNFGADDRIEIRPDVTDAKQRIGLMEFDLGGIPPGATITSATFQAQVYNTATWDANIYQMVTPWTESGATWNTQNGVSSWSSGAFSSADYNATLYGALDLSSANPPAVDATSLVQSWVSGAPNEGIALVGNSQSTDYAKIFSREENDATRRPKLIINWSLAPTPGVQTTTSLHVTPLLVGGSGQVVVTMQVEAGATVTSVTPPASLTVNSLGPIATLASGPSPAGPVTVSPGNPATFTYVYNVTPGSVPATVRFSGAPTSPNATFAPAQSECVIVTPPLTFRVQVNNPATTGQVCNRGYIQDNGVIPSTASNQVCTFIPEDPNSPGGSIGDTVYSDLNGNGTQDVGEPGLPNIQVCTTNGIRTVCGTTDANGIYLLSGLESGTWTTTLNLATVPPGYIPTTPTTVNTPLAPFQAVTTVDFGLQAGGTGRIGDLVWLDQNNNGVKDGAEVGLPNVSLKLYRDLNNNNIIDGGDNLVAVTSTDANGLYTFTGLPAARYLVQVDPTSQVTTPSAGVTTIGAAMTLVSGTNPHVVNLLAGQNYTAADFGYNWSGVIGDTVFYDTNGNGIQDPGETGVPNATVDLYLDLNANGEIDPGEQAITVVFTNNTGFYLFTNVAPGNYVVYVEEQTIESPTQPGQFGTVIPTTDEEEAVTLNPGQSFLNADFGFIERALIGDSVFHDLNANGVQDPGEPGLPGVQVTLYDATGVTLLGTATTDASGVYHLPVPPGTYRVGVNTGAVPPALNTPTTPINYTVTVNAGQEITSVDFGFAYSGKIGDTVFNDANGNGVQNAGEAGIPGVTMQLYSDPNSDGNPIDGTLLRVTTTDVSGKYLFSGLADGPYVVRVDPTTVPALWTQTADPDQPGVPCTVCDGRSGATIAGGNSILTKDFGYRAPGQTFSVSGTVFQDTDGSGVQNPGEPGLPGVTVVLKGPGPDNILGTPDDVVVATVVTDANGDYLVSGIPSGSNLTVAVDPTTLPNPAYVSTTPPGGAYTLTNITSNITDRDFGYIAQPGSISGTVCVGASGGLCQPGDPPLPGVTLTLIYAGPDGLLGTPDDTTSNTTTDVNGDYSFSNRPAGLYQIVKTNPPGYISVADADGGNPDNISVSLLAGQNVIDRDFKVALSGVTATPTPTPTPTVIPGSGTIAGTVYNDQNNNGVRDLGEPGIPSVTIRLYGPGPDGNLGTLDDVLVSVQVTDGAGGYTFPNLPPGIYRVNETDPDGYASTTPNDVTVLVNPNGTVVVNFGDRLAPATPTPTPTPAPAISAITGTVFNDIDGDGAQDPGEAGLFNVTVQLLDPSTSAVLASTTTAGNGAYTFSSLTPGPYLVREIDPPGYTSTTPNTVPAVAPVGGVAVVNFGDQQIGTVSGVVFNDLNGDGTQDVGEPGIPGVTVQLIDPTTNTVVATTTTNAPNGDYLFTGVNPGPYIVRETDPVGFTSTTPNNVPVSVAPAGAAVANFGDQQIGTINGVVFNDLNANGVQDPYEPGIAGVTVRYASAGFDGLLGSPDDVVQGTTTTDANGRYSFSGVPQGTYLVTETDPPGFSSTTPNQVPVSVPAGGAGHANFGDLQTGSVVGTVTNDFNGNGVAEPGEPGIQGVTIRLFSPGPDGFLGTLDDILVATTTTNQYGDYTFIGVTPGSYLVRETDPLGFISTSPNAVPISVPPGGVGHADFTDQMIGTISGVVYNDLNGNQARDPNEPGIGGVTIDLINPNTLGVIATTTTAGDGTYLFTSVPAGTYTVRETDPTGFTSTTPNNVSVTVPPGGAGHANFGDQQIGTISGVSFVDINGDGIQDPGEVGIGGVTVRLLNSITLGLIAATTTAGDGSYLFAPVSPGNYIVQEVTPPGYASTTPDNVNVTVPAGGAGIANFGNQIIGSVLGVVFNDINGSGVQELGEPGIGGVTVTLVAPGPDNTFNTPDDVTTAQTTLPDGSYQFLGVIPGSYQVRETDPVGFVSTTPNTVPVTAPPGGAGVANFGDQLRQQPTLVALRSLYTNIAGSDVAIQWEIATPVNVSGFRVWRSAQAESGYQQVGPALLPLAPEADSTSVYHFIDQAVPAGTWFYWVEVVSVSNQVIGSGGPIAAEVLREGTMGRYRLFLPSISRATR